MATMDSLTFGLIENTSIATATGVLAGLSKTGYDQRIPVVGPLSTTVFRMMGLPQGSGLALMPAVRYAGAGAVTGVGVNALAALAPTLGISLPQYSGSTYVSAASGAGGALIGYGAAGLMGF